MNDDDDNDDHQHYGRTELRPGKVWKPRSHVLQAEMLHLDIRRSETLDALFEKLERQVRFVGC